MGYLRDSNVKLASLLGYVLAEDGNDARRRARKKYPRFTITDIHRKI